MRSFRTCCRAAALAGLLTIPALLADPPHAHAGPMPEAREGWVIMPTPHAYPELVERVDAAVEASPLNIVTRASATVGAKNLGRTIPGNMVVGVYAPAFAVRMLEASIAAGIEAPLRLYLTENEDGTATLSYELAREVFGAYEDGGEALATLAGELDVILADIAQAAIGP